MQLATNKAISKAIQKATNYCGVMVSKAQGSCRFYFDDEYSPQGIDLSLTEAQYVNSIKDWSVSQWVDAFKYELEMTHQPTKRPSLYVVIHQGKFVAYDSILDSEAIYLTFDANKAATFKTKQEAQQYGRANFDLDWGTSNI